MPKHIFGANMKIAVAAETTDYGVKGSAATPGAGDLLPPDWTESITKENIPKVRGQIGLEGHAITPVIVGENVAGGLTGNLYFTSDPIWFLIAAAFGEETVTGSDPYTHTFGFGENYYNSGNANGGTLNRHATVEVEAIEDGYTIQSFKASTCEFTFTRDEGVVVALNGTGYVQTQGAIDPSSWTGLEAESDLVLLSNTCTWTMRVGTYAADKTLAAGDNIRPSSVTLSIDQSNDANPDTGTGLGIAEPTMTPSGRKATLTWVQDYGDDDADYGQRDWTAEHNAKTKLQATIQITTSGDDDILFKFSRLFLTGPGKPIVDGPDVIAMTYTADVYISNESMTNTFEGMDNMGLEIVLVNDRAGTYLQATP